MKRTRLMAFLGTSLIMASILLALRSDAQQPKGKGAAKKKGKASPTSWIWTSKTEEKQTVFFRKEISVDQKYQSVRLAGSCDNAMTVYINGKAVATSDSWESPLVKDVTSHFHFPGKGDGPVKNVVAVEGRNDGAAAGLVMRLSFEGKKGGVIVGTDSTWKASAKKEAGWEQVAFNDSKWNNANVLTVLGGGPWFQVNAQALAGSGKLRKPTATPVELIKVKKDYKVELLYSVPMEEKGSWVNMTFDPKGRAIVSDQYGRLYRVTPPALGGNADDTKVEQIPADIGEAHGLLWAFDSLYVVVNRGKKYDSGLYRVTSSKNDDQLDKVELLQKINGGGEHGPHGVVLSPDGKSLVVCAGNHTKLVKLSSTTVPEIWGEDSLVPRLWDASGHAVGIMAPAGCIYQVTPDGKDWKLLSMGYRNEFDIAYNRNGDLFTYDSDMEWDMSLPWYRPTRVCHAVDGSEFGWRGGTGKMYEYHPDNLPPTVNIGPGSPTGVAFGYGAKFPAKYQDAFFICDWSYGKLYAVHLKANGASYVGEAEEFMNGSPLPLTDLAVNPKDGALYFTIGGRNTSSGFYRITYVGKESVAPSETKDSPTKEASIRKKLEGLYGKKDSASVEIAWPHLSSPDRFVRWSARTVLEFQEPSAFQERAFAEKNPVAATQAMIALARLNAKGQGEKVLETLGGIDTAKLAKSEKIDWARAFQLAFHRLETRPEDLQRYGKLLTGRYNGESDPAVRVEMGKVIAHSKYPAGVPELLNSMLKAPSQEEQIEYALMLRTTGMVGQDYFKWFHKAATYRGGNSFHAFLRNIRNDAIKSLGDGQRVALKADIDNVPQPSSPKFSSKPRPFVKKWTVDELTPLIEAGMKGRNFDKGRELFGEAKCFTCHRYANEGGGLGPDLTGLAGRFSVRDLLDSILIPSKTISDQYQAITVTTTDGRIITGRIVNLAGVNISINTDMLDPNKLVGVNRSQIDTIAPSPISMMPDGLFDNFQREEILDLMAYLLSRGDRNHQAFKK